MVGSLAFAHEATDAPIVIVSSYNPEIRNLNDNITAFSEKYSALGGKSPIKVENMNCRNLSEACEWTGRLWHLLSRYYENGKQPAAVVLLGVEASSAFISLDKPEIKSTPALIGMRGDNIVKLPVDSVIDTKTWNPSSYYLSTDFSDYTIIGASVYRYDIAKNLQMVKKMYPECDSLVFLTDNTFGGVTLRAHFLRMQKEHPGYQVMYLDGREMAFHEVNNAIAELSGNKAIIIGTWRIDSTDSYALGNTTYSLGNSNMTVPAFTLTSVGLGHWAIGGYVPKYQTVGDQLAQMCYTYQTSGKHQGVKCIDSEYKFDYNKLQQYHIDEQMIPDGSTMINEPVSMWDEYGDIILMVSAAFILLLIGLITSIFYLRLSRKLQQKLIVRGQELEEAKNRAEAANQMKSTFIANMSHEIRTPLNAVIGFTQVLTDPHMEFTPEERVEYGNYITANGEVLLNLINDILDISKVDSGTMKFNIDRINLAELCETAVASARSGYQNTEVSIVTKMPDYPVEVETDRLRMLQILHNLLSNAKKFTKKGSITVAYEKESTPDMVCISVTDTGTGIPLDKMESVFERFKKLDNFTQGTGLGLYITRSFIETFGGRIWVDANYTDGARFVFTLPVKSVMKEKEDE